MFNVAFNGIITVNRGDSFELPLMINGGSSLYPTNYQIDNKSYVYLGIMEPNQPFETALIRKKATLEDVQIDENGDQVVIFKFKPQETQCVLPGKYYYQIKLQRFLSEDPEDYTVDTIVDKTLFWILE